MGICVRHMKAFSAELGMMKNATSVAITILDKANAKGLLEGHRPEGNGAAALYIAGILTDDRRTLKQLAAVAGVSESTISNRYKVFVKELGIKRR